MVEALILGLLAGLIHEFTKLFNKPEPCPHNFRLTYHSKHEQQCYDCGERFPIEYSYYPRHQR